jgi:hypothetical protein
MPQIFKVLVSITVWVLFIHGLVAIVGGGIEFWVMGGGRLTLMAAISCSIGTVNLILAAVAAKLRQMLE